MWPRLHFTPLGERPGRSRDRLPLTIWFRDFGHPTLFSVFRVDSELPIAALDANVVIDLAEGKPATTDPLMADWMRSEVRIAITDEVFLELDKKQDAELRARNRRYASGLLRLHADEGTWKPLFATLKASVRNPEKFDADLRHVARAAAGGARWFVTWDDNFRRACATTAKQVADIDVVTPGELLLAIDSLVQDGTYRPTDLSGSSLQFRDIRPGELDDVAREFVNEREGESLARLRKELHRAATGVPKRRLRVLLEDENYLGLLVWQEAEILDITACRVRRGGKAQPTIARQLVGIARTVAVERGLAAVRLSDPHCGEWVRRAAIDECYLAAGPGFTALPVPGMGSRAGLEDRVQSALASLPPDAVPSSLIAIARDCQATVRTEDLFHPWRLVTDEIPTFVLSIEPFWAAELFDADLARGSLFPRRKTLALQREHVYYRSPAAGGGLTAPARLLWYVKGGPTSQRGLRAISTLRDVVVGDPLRLYRRFAHLGAYDQNQVTATSRNQRVMALRFSHTSMLPRAISLDEYRDAMRAAGRGLNLQGPQRLPEHAFASLANLFL